MFGRGQTKLSTLTRRLSVAPPLSSAMTVTDTADAGKLVTSDLARVNSAGGVGPRNSQCCGEGGGGFLSKNYTFHCLKDIFVHVCLVIIGHTKCIHFCKFIKPVVIDHCLTEDMVIISNAIILEET